MQQRKKQPQITRQAILQATGTEFAKHGYSGTGLGQIVSRSGLTKGALFHHFPDKRSLAAAWIRENLTAEFDTRWSTPLAGISSLDALKAHCRSQCIDLRPDDSISLFTLLAAETAAEPTLGIELKSLHTRWKATLTTLLERGKTEGWIHRSIQPAVEAAFLVSTFCGFTIAAKCEPEESTRRASAAAIEGYLETLRTN